MDELRTNDDEFSERNQAEYARLDRDPDNDARWMDEDYNVIHAAENGMTKYILGYLEKNTWNVMEQCKQMLRAAVLNEEWTVAQIIVWDPRFRQINTPLGIHEMLSYGHTPSYMRNFDLGKGASFAAMPLIQYLNKDIVRYLLEMYCV